MEKSIKKEKIWAIPREHAVSFFQQQPDVQPSEDGFAFEACTIRLISMPDRSLGSLHFPQTTILLEGCEKDVEEIYKRFYYNFLSAGG